MELAELETIGPVEFGRRPAGGQATLFDESEVERETKPHDGKRPGEFAPKPKRPQTSGGQMLLVDSGVSDHPVERKPVQSAMPPEVTAPVQPAPLEGQKELFQAKFVPHPLHRDYPDEFETVHADAGKLDREWAKEPASYLPSNGRGRSEVDGRRDNFKAFLGTGKAIEQPHVVANDSGQLGFNDGRHRARVLMDMGHKTIPLSVPVEDAARIRSLVGVEQEFSRDLESIGPVEFSSWDESKHHRESETHDGKKPGEFAPEGGNGHELAEEDAARTQRAQQAAATKPPETFASDAPLPKPYQFWERAPLSEVLGDIPQRPAWLRKRDQVSKMPWTEAHESAQHAAAKYDVNIDDVVATMPAAHAHMLSGMIEREDAKKDARKITGLTARHEYADSDWSNIPRFDETAREVAGLHPEIGIRPDDHYAPQLMWDFIREGKLKLPSIDSRETADMAASMLATARRSGPVHFNSDEDEEREPAEDEWTVVHQGDTSFDPSQFSRENEVDDIAKALGIDSAELLAAISDIDDGVRATIRNRNSTVIGIAIRNRNKIEIRDANSKLAGTITKAGGKSTFRSREGRAMGSVGEFSRVDGPVEFSRIKPAEGQSVLDFDEPEPKPAKTKHRDGLGRAVNPRTGQVQARKGGEKSEVDGEWYAGGEWMPVHGLTRKSEPREKSLATPDSGTFKPNENQKPKYTEPRVLSPQDLDAAKQKKADQSKWDEIKSGPLGKVKWLGDSPNAKGMHYLTSMNQWHDYAESAGPAEIKRITGELESVWSNKVREAAKHEKDLPEDSIEYWMNTPKQQAEQEIGMYPRANGTHEKRIPGSAYARQLIQHLLDGDSLKSDQRSIDNMHDIHRVLSGTYESEFSRDIGPEEFARHSFSSTQFNIEDAGYSRSDGSPIAELKELAASIPDDELADDGREDHFHVTALYGLTGDTPDEVEELVSGFGPVHITLGKTSIFPAKEGADYDVVKIDIEGDDIHRLNKLLKELDHTSTHPKFSPHMTLAYVKAGEGRKYVGDNPLTGRKLSFTRLQFSDKDRNKTAIQLNGKSIGEILKAVKEKESEFSRDDDWVFAPLDDGPVEFARPIRPGAGQQSFGWSDDEVPQATPASSNVHSFRFEPGGPGGGNLIVRYLNNKKDGPGPEYRYFTGGKSTFNAMKADVDAGRSAGAFTWDHLKLRGSVSGHQVPFELAGLGPDKYVPRAAGLKRGHTGEWFNKRTFQGQESNLAPGPVRKSNGPIPGYDPKKLKLAGDKQAAATPPATPPAPAPAAPAASPTASPAPNPASPPSPPPAPAPKKPSLIDRVLGLFRRKPKDQKPKEFSREEIRDIETVYAAIFREPANLKFDERRNAV
jgi:2'-5' RNA ligase